MEQQASESVAQNRTAVERRSDRELVVTRTFDAPPQMVFKAWSEPDLFRQWWVPKGAPVSLVSCDMDVRTGGKYRLEFGAGEETTPSTANISKWCRISASSGRTTKAKRAR